MWCGVVCDRGWRGAAPSVAVFQCSFSLGTSVREEIVALCLCVNVFRIRSVCVGGGGGGWAGAVRAVNTSKVTSFS